MLSVVYGTSGAPEAHKKPRNARNSHGENPAKSDAVKFFTHTLDTEPYSFFNFKPTIFSHFQQLLQTPDKVLLLTDVNPSRKYPACDINTSNLFDDEGDPIFNLDAQTSPNPATPTPSSSKPKTNKQNTGLKRTLCTSVQKKKRSRKQRADADIVTEKPIQAVPPTATDIAAIAPPPLLTQPTQTALQKPKPFRHPQLLTLPSRIAIPIDPSYQQLLECSFLPVSGLKGNALFNAFLTFCSSNEQHAVLVSRAFVSQSVTLQGKNAGSKTGNIISSMFITCTNKF